MNVAVGGINGYFPEKATGSEKPWIDHTPRAMTDFWNGRQQWLSGWNLNRRYCRSSSLIVDSVKVWAL